MSLVATLVSSPADPQVTEGLIAGVSRVLGGGAHRVLDAGIAADIAVDGPLSRDEAGRRMAEAIGDTPVDFAVLPAEDRAWAVCVSVDK